jgi:hypothetical protein
MLFVSLVWGFAAATRRRTTFIRGTLLALDGTPRRKDTMQGGTHKGQMVWLVLVAALLAVHGAAGREKPKGLPFRFMGGTSGPIDTCKGVLEASSDELTFRCGTDAIAIPYSSITLMEYRANVSRKVRKMKLHWKLVPPVGHGSENRYFTIVYNESGGKQGLVLEVSPEAMRPYLAEIDLRAGRRIDVQNHEVYSYR